MVEGFITGMHRSPYHGFSVEFAEHRHYNSGESTRHIDWKLYGRTEKLYVKRFEEETNLRAQIIIDTSSSMLFPLSEKGIYNKLYFSVYAAAALIRLLRNQRDAVGLTLFSDEIHVSTSARLSRVHNQFLMKELTQLLSRVETDEKRMLNQPTRVANTLHQLAEMYPKRSLVILFSDFFDQADPAELFSAFQHFRYNHHELILFQVMDSQFEGQFDFPSRPHRFVDLETGETIRTNPGEIRESYLQNWKAFTSQLRLRCNQYAIDFNEADIRKDFRDVLLPFLVKRQKLF